MRAWIVLGLGSLIACGDDPGGELPSPNPPPPWGVPISGGTLLVTRDGAQAVVADPDRDRVVAVALADGRIVADLALAAGDEPGRLVEDGAGRIHVALRRGGALVTLDPVTRQIVARRAACSEPRGVAWAATADVVHVACASGELVTFPAAGGDAIRRVPLDRDLRDVIAQGDRLVVTRFRTAEVITLDAAGLEVARVLPPTVRRFDPAGTGSGSSFDVDAIPAVAWRTVALPDGRLVVSHQRQLQATLGTTQGGYAGSCGGPIESSISIIAADSATAIAPYATGALPVDIAVGPTGDLALAIAGARTIHVIPAGHLAIVDDHLGCGAGGDPGYDDQLGAPTAVAFTPANEVVAFYPESPALVVRRGAADARTILLPGTFGYDAGRGVFHAQTGSRMACASCHPEGHQDGLVWDFEGIGARRTQDLAGHITQRAPYHWSGDQPDLASLMSDVFVQRMLGDTLSRSQLLSIGPWLDRIAPPAPVFRDAAQVARGKALFESPATACTQCHAGALFTSNAFHDVGTGGRFKTPSLLGVGTRAPFLHDGCAPSLTDRFGPCGGGDQHGHTSQLDPLQLADLVAYLDAL